MLHRSLCERCGTHLPRRDRFLSEVCVLSCIPLGTSQLYPIGNLSHWSSSRQGCRSLDAKTTPHARTRRQTLARQTLCLFDSVSASGGAAAARLPIAAVVVFIIMLIPLDLSLGAFPLGLSLEALPSRPPPLGPPCGPWPKARCRHSNDINIDDIAIDIDGVDIDLTSYSDECMLHLPS